MKMKMLKKLCLISGSVILPLLSILIVLPITLAYKIADEEDLQREY